jgi:hypothetical protein
MSKLLTVQELLNQHSSQDSTGNVSLSLEADLLLNDSVLTELRQLLKNDPSLATLEVVSKEGNTLGYLSRKAITDYQYDLTHDRNANKQTMGGSISQLEGREFTIPRFRCDVNHPPRELIIAIARQQPIVCPTCGNPMTLVE